MDEITEDWAMYDDEGNAAVAQMMQKVKDALQNRPLPVVRKLLRQGIREVAAEHGEVYDSDVRDTITYRLTRWACQVHELQHGIAIDFDYWGL